MSVQALSWVFDHSPTKGIDRLVLLSIANHAGESPEDGAWEAWPGVKLMAHEAGTDRERTVQDVLARLVTDGTIERVVNGAPDYRIRPDRRPNLYRILLGNGINCGKDRCGICRDGVSSGDIPQEGHGVTPDAARGDVSRPHGVTPGVTQTIIEPSIEPPPPPTTGRTTSAATEGEEEPNPSDDDVTERAGAACDLIGLANHQATKGEVRVPEAHLAKCQEAARARHWQAATEMAERHPDWPPAMMAAEMRRASTGGRNALAGGTSTQAAQRAIAERNEERRRAEAEVGPVDLDAVRKAREEARAALERSAQKPDERG